MEDILFVFCNLVTQGPEYVSDIFTSPAPSEGSQE